MGNEKKVHWMALGINGGNWEQQPQYPIVGTWADAVATCKMQEAPTRLSTSRGFRNQGHYFQPDEAAVIEYIERS